MSLSEFSLIDRYFANIARRSSDAVSAVDLSVGDDCALLTIPAGQQLALSIDTLNAGVHFPVLADASLIAERALAVSISDLAAMGAKPIAYTLAISMPSLDPAWLEKFSEGLGRATTHYSVALIGGDTTQGPLSITVQVHGVLPQGAAIRRSGALVGDSIFVTGSLGDAAAALAVIEERLLVEADHGHYLKARFYQPQARISCGQRLRGIASAAIDVSDGLVADLGHIMRASGVGAELYCAQLPLSAALLASCGVSQAINYALSGGDDYELCFTAHSSCCGPLSEISQSLGLPITEIGKVVEGAGVMCLDQNGDVVDIARRGYQHFSSK